MFVSREHLASMARVIGAVEAVVAKPHFRQAALAWAPDIAGYYPASPGGLLGYDFHLSVTGLQLSPRLALEAAPAGDRPCWASAIMRLR